MPPETDPEYGDTRARVLDAALELFSENGVQSVAVPRIAERANVAVGSIYRVAASKQELAELIHRTWTDKLTLALELESPVPHYKTNADVFFEIWTRLSDWAMANPKAMRFLAHYQYSRDGCDALGKSTELLMYPLDNYRRLWSSETGGLRLSDHVVSALVRGTMFDLVLNRALNETSLNQLGQAVWKVLSD